MADGGDTWSDMQEFMMRKNSLREKMQKRKRECEGLLKDVVTSSTGVSELGLGGSGSATAAAAADFAARSKRARPPTFNPNPNAKSDPALAPAPAPTPAPADELVPVAVAASPGPKDPAVEAELLSRLCEATTALPVDSAALTKDLCAALGRPVTQAVVENLLKKFGVQELLRVRTVPKSDVVSGLAGSGTGMGVETVLLVVSVELDKLSAFAKECRSKADATAAGAWAQMSASTSATSTGAPATKRDRDRLVDSADSSDQTMAAGIRTGADAQSLAETKDSGSTPVVGSSSSSSAAAAAANTDDIMSLLSMQTTKERETKKLGEEILELLSKPTAKERSTVERFRSQGGAQVQEFCSHGTRDECRKARARAVAEPKPKPPPPLPCRKLHFRKIIQKHTDESLGDCSFLNTCFHMDTCKYVHYQVDYEGAATRRATEASSLSSSASAVAGNEGGVCEDADTTSAGNGTGPASSSADLAAAMLDPSSAAAAARAVLLVVPGPEVKNKAHEVMMRPNETTVLFPAQWLQCDLRYFDMSMLGKFAVIMADPPWDIHMELPYGTMSDDEMRQLNVPSLQDDGLIFLWVTGRAMELGRECLALWGYERVDELIWVKTNQLQRIIRTGRTGHWLNHGKEHCLVGMKGCPEKLNRGLDCDVIVAEVRATSHKPDEIYGIIERLSPGTRKIELFGRQHNAQPNWITLGNQLEGIRLVDPELQERFRDRYPDGNCMKPPKKQQPPPPPPPPPPPLL